jgi:Biotin-lipoyl like
MAEETPAARPKGRRRWIAVGALLLIVIVAGVLWFFSGRESTDDAQIEGHITQISARVGGPLVKVNVTDNQAVAASTVLVQIDPRLPGRRRSRPRGAHRRRSQRRRGGHRRARDGGFDQERHSNGGGRPRRGTGGRGSCRSPGRGRAGAARRRAGAAARAGSERRQGGARRGAVQAAGRERGDRAAAVRRGCGRRRGVAGLGGRGKVRRRSGAHRRCRRAAACGAGPRRGRARPGGAARRAHRSRANRDHQSSSRERGRPRQAGQGDARSGRTQPGTHLDQSALRGHRQSQVGGSGPDGAARTAAAGARVARERLGRRQFQGDAARRGQGRSAGDGRSGRARREGVQRPRGQHRGRHRRAIQPAPSRECHGQLREGRAACSSG